MFLKKTLIIMNFKHSVYFYYNLNNNAFTIDMVYRWVFAPASEINIVWKNSIFNTNNNATLNYFRNVNELMELGALNSFSIRFTYFFDTLYLKKLKKSKNGRKNILIKVVNLKTCWNANQVNQNARLQYLPFIKWKSTPWV